MSLGYFADIDPVSPDDSVLHAPRCPMVPVSMAYPHVARDAVSVMPPSGGVDADEIAALLRRWPMHVVVAAPTIVKRPDAPAFVDADLSHLKTII